MRPTLRQKTARLLDRIAQSLPHVCALCHSACASGLCESCLGRYFSDKHPRCRQCAHPLAGNKNESRLCGACLKQPPAFDRTITVTDYVPPVDQLVQSLKFGGNLALAPLFAQQLENAIRKQYPGDLPYPSILLPVPLAGERLATRGFNQALEIARPLSRRLGIPLVPHLIRRIRETAPQTAVGLKERRENIRKAFAIHQPRHPALQGAHAGIVDDVLTTGETLGEIARMLRQAGAKSVSCFVFARTPL